MQRISLFCLLAVLAGAPTIATAQTATPQLVARGGVAIGMTKAQVRAAIGNPTRASANAWYYANAGDGPLTIYFKGDRVSGLGGQG